MRQPFTLSEGNWYAMTMYPGYADVPYYSPIRVHSLITCKDGSRRFDLGFLNMFYAAGVQNMVYSLTMLQRGSEFILARHRNSDRAISLVEVTSAWLQQHAPDLYRRLEQDLKQGMPFYAALEEAGLSPPTFRP